MANALNVRVYCYTFKPQDHLGNTRVLFSDIDGDGQIDLSANSPEVMQTLSYYPIGMTIEGMNQSDKSVPEHLYQYNGKELQKNGMYDYGARWYMPDIGRWGVVDPLAEHLKQIGFSPFHYTFNNPVRFIDPDGRFGMDRVGNLNLGDRSNQDPTHNSFVLESN